MSITTTSTSLLVAAGCSPTSIGVQPPSDSQYPTTKLKIRVTSLPTDGTIYLADGVTPVLPGELLTVDELTGLRFAGDLGAAGSSSDFSYEVIDPAGATASGSARLSVTANVDGPQTAPDLLRVAPNSGPTLIGITAPTDPNESSNGLLVNVLGLPSNGTVLLSDGFTTVAAGQALTVTQLTGLEFVPTPGLIAESGSFSYRVTDSTGNSSLGTATLSIAPLGNVLTVGPGQQFATIAAAIAASHDGDTIQVQAGTYTNDFATVNTKITLEGVGGMVNMVATESIPNGKAILVTNTDVTINNFSFSGATVADGNGAGIRYQLGNLFLNYDAFFNNQDGLLGGSGGVGSITINHSEFADNGTGDGFTHNLYVGDIETLTISDSYFHDANVGHEIKSRALNTIIENSRVIDGPAGTASYSIDLPNGGNALIQNNVIEQGPFSENPTLITSGEEGNVYANSSLIVTGNVILNDLASGSSLAIRNDTTATAQITDNGFFGLTPSQVASGPNLQSDNTFLSSEPALDLSHPWSPEIACFLRGTRILTKTGEQPVEELEIGNIVITLSGALKPIKWIGRRAYDSRFIAGNSAVMPIRIMVGAFGHGLPVRDLWLSPEHALYLDAALVPARLLVNGNTIVQPDCARHIEYFHVELEQHDVIIAEGVPVESYVECDNRGMFQNASEFAALYPSEPMRRPLFCAPRLEFSDAEQLHLVIRSLGHPTCDIAA